MSANLPPPPEDSSGLAVPLTTARPMRASSILQAAIEQCRREGPERRLVLSGWRELDEYVLLGGLERGGVVGVSGDLEEGVGRILSLHLLTTCLLSNPYAKASIIDVTGSFPISLLAKIIDYRIKSHHNIKGNVRLEVEAEVDQKVQDILGRVSISRVFDIEGVWEVLSEISNDCHSQARRWNSGDRGTVEGEHREMPMPPTESNLTIHSPTESLVLERSTPSKGKEILDSQDEDDEELDFDPEVEEAITLSQEVLRKPKDPAQPFITSTSEVKSVLSPKEPEIAGKIEIIIVDNMTTCIGDLFSKREKTTAHTLLQTLSRTLFTMSQTHSILTLLLNSLIDPNKSHPSTNHHHHPTAQRSSTSSKPTPSIFTSTTSRPALGRIFDNFISLHLMISKVPKTARDAEILYATPPSPSPPPQAPLDIDPDPQDYQQPAQQPPVQYSHVIEVLKDTVMDLSPWLESANENSASRRPRGQRRRKARRRRRTQRWAPFVISSDGLTLLDAFPGLVAAKKGKGAGVMAAAEPEMHIVKQFPFGRRM